MQKIQPVVLLILDGWGYRPETTGNAIAAAKTPTWDYIMKNYPHALLSASGEDVGLPDGQMGNSEVGHLTIGAGRVIYQDLTRISKEIDDGKFADNEIINQAMNKARDTHKAVHIMGLLSPGGVHSHEDHIFACLEMAKQKHCDKIYVHAFLDGRDTPPQSATASIEKLASVLHDIPGSQLASVSGRYYAMDRDKRWERVKQAYDAIVEGKAAFYAQSGMDALTKAYERLETDEFVKPTCITTLGKPPITIEDGDVVIYMNFRSDRARALTVSMTQPDFKGFERSRLPQLGEFVTLTEYDKTYQVSVAFAPQTHSNVLGEYLQNCGLTQLHLAETEKYAHVTFFFNGGIEKPYHGEERILISSPKIATYDLEPKMSAFELTQKLVDNILQKHFDFIVCNFANADMVGHTGNFKATVKAVEALDLCLGQILRALEAVKGQALITSDHGNAECMVDQQTGQNHTAHTTAFVPVVYIGEQKLRFISKEGKLSDIAPTILQLMGLNIPPEMTGHSLVKP